MFVIMIASRFVQVLSTVSIPVSIKLFKGDKYNTGCRIADSRPAAARRECVILVRHAGWMRQTAGQAFPAAQGTKTNVTTLEGVQHCGRARLLCAAAAQIVSQGGFVDSSDRL